MSEKMDTEAKVLYRYEGKVRKSYSYSWQGKNVRILVSTDRVSAFDQTIPSLIPGKGIVLNQLSAFWFKFFEHDLKTHFITVDNDKMPEMFRTRDMQYRCMMVEELQMLPIEAICRGYLTGSAKKSYDEDGTVQGTYLAPGLVEASRFPEPLFTPTSKAPVGEHDQPLDTGEMLGIIHDFCGEIEAKGETLPHTPEYYAAKLEDESLDIYEIASIYAEMQGIIIADTKLEFGLDDKGELMLGDELLTPDSSRFWEYNNYEEGQAQKSFDKQLVRDWIKAHWRGEGPLPTLPRDVIKAVQERYIKCYKMLTGEDLPAEALEIIEELSKS